MIAIEEEAPPRALRSIWSAAGDTRDVVSPAIGALPLRRRVRPRRNAAWWVVAVSTVLLLSFAVGGLTSFAQTFLPESLASLANSAAPWMMIAVAATAALRPRWWLGAVLVTVSLVLMNVGYGVVSTMRGFPYEGGLSSVWTVGALVVGPVLGIAAVWLFEAHAIRSALAAAAIATVPVGEGLHGLIRVAVTTNPVYWAVELALGVLLVVAVSVRLRRSPSAIAVTASLTGVGATLYLVLLGVM